MDGDAKVTITIKPRQIERVVFGVIIAILLFLLILSYLGDTSTDVDDELEEEVEVEVEAPPEEEETVETPTETCSDSKKNQDETDVDCGGTCGGCPSGDTCKTPADCAGDYCTASKCSSTAPVVYSGDVDLTITDVKTTVNENTNAAKVTEIAFQLENGMNKDLGLLKFDVLLTSKRDTGYCLSQADGDETSCSVMYATFSHTGPKKGKTLKTSVELDSKYTGASYVNNYGASSYYEHGDDFNLYIYVYDNSGNQIGGKTIRAFRTVSP